MTYFKYSLIAFYIIMIFVHVLVIAQVVPYSWVNGGLSPSYEYQSIQSAISIVFLSIITFYVFDIFMSMPRPKTWKRRLFYTLTSLTGVSLFMQLIGSDFERFVLAPVVLAGFIVHLKFAIKLKSIR